MTEVTLSSENMRLSYFQKILFYELRRKAGGFSLDINQESQSSGLAAQILVHLCQSLLIQRIDPLDGDEVQQGNIQQGNVFFKYPAESVKRKAS